MRLSVCIWLLCIPLPYLTSSTVQITLFFFNPTMTVILAWACLGEPLLPLAMAGIACSLVGVVVVAKPPFIFGGHETWNHKRVAGAPSMQGCGIHWPQLEASQQPSVHHRLGHGIGKAQRPQLEAP